MDINNIIGLLLVILAVAAIGYLIHRRKEKKRIEEQNRRYGGTPSGTNGDQSTKHKL